MNYQVILLKIQIRTKGSTKGIPMKCLSTIFPHLCIIDRNTHTISLLNWNSFLDSVLPRSLSSGINPLTWLTWASLLHHHHHLNSPPFGERLDRVERSQFTTFQSQFFVAIVKTKTFSSRTGFIKYRLKGANLPDGWSFRGDEINLR